MTADKPDSKQEISSGDGGENYQAGRDLTVHNHPTPARPLIVPPTPEQVAEFDPKTREIIRTVKLLTYAQRIVFSQRWVFYCIRPTVISRVISGVVIVVAVSAFIRLGLFDHVAALVLQMLKSLRGLE